MKSTTPIHKIKTEFSLDQSTSIGGSKIFLDYLEKIKLSQVLQILAGGKAHTMHCSPCIAFCYISLSAGFSAVSVFFTFADGKRTLSFSGFLEDAVHTTPFSTKNWIGWGMPIPMFEWNSGK